MLRKLGKFQWHQSFGCQEWWYHVQDVDKTMRYKKLGAQTHKISYYLYYILSNDRLNIVGNTRKYKKVDRLKLEDRDFASAVPYPYHRSYCNFVE